MNLLKLTLQLNLLAGSAVDPQPIPLAQVAPGRYRAELKPPGGPFALSVIDESGQGGVIWRRAFGHFHGREFAAIGANWPNLRRLADLTGGRIVSPGQLAGLTRQWSSRRYCRLWPVLLAAAVAVMLIEWAAIRTWRRSA